jgi:hypothetical protein
MAASLHILTVYHLFNNFVLCVYIFRYMQLLLLCTKFSPLYLITGHVYLASTSPPAIDCLRIDLHHRPLIHRPEYKALPVLRHAPFFPVDIIFLKCAAVLHTHPH